MSPGWQAGICGTAAVWFRQIGWRACQSVGRRANRSAGVPIGWRASQVAPLRFLGGGLVPSNRSAGVTSGAPTFPGRRFVNRRGDIHVARMAGGNMRDRGGLVPSIHLRACQSVGGRVNRSAGVPNRLRASQVAPLRLPGGSLVPPNRWRASQVAFLRFPGGGLSIVGATFMSPGWQAGICGNDGLKQVPEADRNTSSSNNPIKTKNHADSKIIKRCGNAGFRLWRVSGDSRGV